MFGLPDRVLTLLKHYFSARPEVIRVWVFGSRAMGKNHPGSDVDLAVLTSADQDLSGHIQAELEELSTPYLFDVVDYQRISYQPLKEHIDRVGKLLYEK